MAAGELSEAARSTLTLADRDLLRGTSVEVLLSCFGRTLRSTAGGTGFVEEGEDGFRRSFRVDELDVFLSHSWHATWWLKYITLLLHFNAVPAVAAALLVCILNCAIAGIPRQGVTWQSVLAFFAVLFSWHHFISMLKVGGTSIFLDKVCIHQTDPVRKAGGIKSIGAILCHSRSVLVAWDRSYFTRLWCTFELAAFKHAKPGGEVVVLPVTLGGFIMCLMSLHMIMELLKSNLLNELEQSPLKLYMAGRFLILVVSGEGFRYFFDDIALLREQLENFSVRNSQCFCCNANHRLPGTGAEVPCDRKLVYASIVHWYGSRSASRAGESDPAFQEGLDRFDTVIRGRFKEQISEVIRGTRVSYPLVLVCGIWECMYQLSKVAIDHPVQRILLTIHTFFLEFPITFSFNMRAFHFFVQKPGFTVRTRRFVTLLGALLSTFLLGVSKSVSWLIFKHLQSPVWGFVLIATEVPVAWSLYNSRPSPEQASTLGLGRRLGMVMELQRRG